jgi:SAM-dependent methyltransferase
MTGVDISRTSIEEARKEVPEARLFVHDMREPLVEGAFDAACCLFTSLGYFDDREDDHRVFRAVFRSLHPGGLFVVDFMNTERVLRELVPEEKLVREGVIFEITRQHINGVLVKRIHVIDGATELDFEERVQALSPKELEEMAREAGFEVLDRTDGPVMEPYDPERAERYVLWLRKPIP